MAHATDVDLNELVTDVDEITDNFMKAADHLKGLASNLDDKTLLNLYALYKQAIEGSCNIPKPSWYNPKGRAKWDAWNSLQNMSEDEAKSSYIKLVENLDPNFAVSDTKGGWTRVSIMHSSEMPLAESDKSLVDYVKEGNYSEVATILTSYNSSDIVYLINKLDEDGLGLIHWAADRGFSEILNLIISHGADVNLVDSDMQTALHYAASCGHFDCIKELLKNKADVNLKDAEGLDPKAVALDENIKKLLSSVS